MRFQRTIGQHVLHGRAEVRQRSASVDFQGLST